METMQQQMELQVLAHTQQMAEMLGLDSAHHSDSSAAGGFPAGTVGAPAGLARGAFDS